MKNRYELLEHPDDFIDYIVELRNGQDPSEVQEKFYLELFLHCGPDTFLRVLVIFRHAVTMEVASMCHQAIEQRVEGGDCTHQETAHMHHKMRSDAMQDFLKIAADFDITDDKWH